MIRPETIKGFIKVMLVLALGISLAPLAQIASADSYRGLDQASLCEGGKLSPELQSLAIDSSSNESVRVIVQTRSGLNHIDANVRSRGGKVNQSLPLIG